MADIATINGVADANIASINGVTTRDSTMNGVTWPAPAAAIALTANATTTSTLSTFTFSSQAFGVASAGRKIIVGATVHGDSVGNVSSCTIGGVTATLIVEKTSNAGGGNAAIWIASVPTGTTGNVVIVYTGTKSGCGIGVWAMTDGSSAANDTATANNANPLVCSINIPANGVCVMVAGDGGGSGSVVWTNLTEDYDTPYGTKIHSGASDAFSTLQTARSITADQSAGAEGSAAAASFGPA